MPGPQRVPRRVLVIEADPDYRTVMVSCAGRAGGRPEAVGNLEEAEASLREGAYDLIIWGIPPGSGARQVASLRELTQGHLILIDESYDKAKGAFEAGADQILPRPFVPGALVGAIRAGLRRAAGLTSGFIDIPGVSFDVERRTVEADEGAVVLTRREWELLTFLLASPGRYFSASELVKEAWQNQARAPEQLRSYIARIRRKLGDLNVPIQILSQQGRGYCLAVDGGTATQG